MKCLVVGFCLYRSSFSSYINHQNQNQDLQPQRQLRGFYFERMTIGLLSFLFLGIWKNWVLKPQIRPEPSSSTNSVCHHHLQHHCHLKGPHTTLKLQLQVHILTCLINLSLHSAASCWVCAAVKWGSDAAAARRQRQPNHLQQQQKKKRSVPVVGKLPVSLKRGKINEGLGAAVPATRSDGIRQEVTGKQEVSRKWRITEISLYLLNSNPSGYATQLFSLHVIFSLNKEVKNWHETKDKK